MQEIRSGKYEEKFKKVWLSFSDPQIVSMQVNFKIISLELGPIVCPLWNFSVIMAKEDFSTDYFMAM